MLTGSFHRMPYPDAKAEMAELMVRQGRRYPRGTDRPGDGVTVFLCTSCQRTIFALNQAAKGVPNKIDKLIAESVTDVAKKQQKP
jgi:hypothetical protein